MGVTNKLTDKHLRNLAPCDKEQSLGDGGGLWVRVMPAAKGGAISFYYRFIVEGRERRFNCGTYPEVSLANARERRNAARQHLRSGIDPVEKERLDKLTAAAELARERMEKTVSEVFEDWRTVYLSVNRKDKGEQIRSAMDKHVLPRIGKLRAKDIVIGHVIQVLDAVVRRGARRTANSLLSALRQMFRHGMARGLVDRDPTLGLTKKQVGGKDRPRDRNLSASELRELAKKLPASGIESRIQSAIWLLLATGARVGELSKARWSDFDLADHVWQIPAEHSKNGRTHLVHLSSFAMDRLEELRTDNSSPFVLAGRDNQTPIDGKTISKAIRDRIREAPLKKRTPRCKALKLTRGDWSAHDLRRTFASRMGDLGVDPHIIERCLNHVPQGIVGVYQRQEYLPERKLAYDKIGAFLLEVHRHSIEVADGMPMDAPASTPKGSPVRHRTISTTFTPSASPLGAAMRQV